MPSARSLVASVDLVTLRATRHLVRAFQSKRFVCILSSFGLLIWSATHFAALARLTWQPKSTLVHWRTRRQKRCSLSIRCFTGRYRSENNRVLSRAAYRIKRGALAFVCGKRAHHCAGKPSIDIGRSCPHEVESLWMHNPTSLYKRFSAVLQESFLTSRTAPAYPYTGLC